MVFKMGMVDGLKWTGTIAGVLGALIVALNISLSGYGFVVFLVGSLSWVAAGVLMREPAIWILNLAFTTANFIGIWRWLLAGS